MTAPRDPLTHTRKWLVHAEEDLEAAETLLETSGDTVPNVICYHCQQCAEKYLKALLVFRGEAFPRTHDLVVLLTRIGRSGSIEIDAPIVSPLNRYATETRYPGDWEPVTRAEAEGAVEAARAVRNCVRRLLPKEVTD